MRTADNTNGNPIGYSTRLLLLLTVCLLFAQHYLPPLAHDEVTRDYLVNQSRGQVVRQISYLTLGLIGIVGAVYCLGSRRVAFKWDMWLVVPLALLLIWCALSVGWSFTPLIAAKRLFVIILMFLGSFGLVLSWTRLEALQMIALSSCIHVSIGVVLEIIYGYFTPILPDYRFAGTLTPNEQGYLCMVLAISSLCLIRVLKAEGVSSSLYKFLTAYGLVFLLLTRSRGALIALAVAIVFYFLLVLDWPKKTLATLLLGTLTMILTVSGAGSSLIDTLNRGGEGSQNLTGRAPLWTELMTYVDERPWTGRGYESFWTASTIDDVYKHQHWPIDSAHSQYIESLLTIGIVGTIIQSLALLMGIIEGVRRYRSTKNPIFFLAASLCCIYLVGGYLEAILIVKPSPISFYLCMLLWLTMIKKDERDVHFDLVAAGKTQDLAVQLS